LNFKNKGMPTGHSSRPEKLGDFTTTWEILPISALAIGIGVLSAFVALALLRLIAGGQRWFRPPAIILECWKSSFP
jgi:hypothetical protein